MLSIILTLSSATSPPLQNCKTSQQFLSPLYRPHWLRRVPTVVRTWDIFKRPPCSSTMVLYQNHRVEESSNQCVPISYCWEREGSPQVVGGQPSNLPKPFQNGVRLLEYSRWVNNLLSLRSYLINHFSYFHSCWTNLFTGPAPFTLHSQPPHPTFHSRPSLLGFLGPSRHVAMGWPACSSEV